jgi:hypothetical protein
MRKNCTSGSVRGAPGNRRPYRGDRQEAAECQRGSHFSAWFFEMAGVGLLIRDELTPLVARIKQSQGYAPAGFDGYSGPTDNKCSPASIRFAL